MEGKSLVIKISRDDKLNEAIAAECTDRLHRFIRERSLPGEAAGTVADWDTTFIPCRNHPERRCNRSAFVKRGVRLCGSCKNNRTPAHRRYMHSEQRRWRTRSTRRWHRLRENRI
jgi:hypothetical protein